MLFYTILSKIASPDIFKKYFDPIRCNNMIIIQVKFAQHNFSKQTCTQLLESPILCEIFHTKWLKNLYIPPNSMTFAGQFKFIHDFGVRSWGRNVQSLETHWTFWVGIKKGFLTANAYFRGLTFGFFIFLWEAQCPFF